jgi:hypothetical protein
VHHAFQQLRKSLGWKARGSHPFPRIHDLRQHADFLIMPTQYSKPALVATETHLESA